MNTFIIFLELSVVVLLGSANTWNNYDSFNEQLRTHIDKAIIRANEQFRDHGKHLNFYRLTKQHTEDPHSYFVNMTLLPTTCGQIQTEFKQRKKCTFPKITQLMIDCVVCKPHSGEELIHCVRHRDVIKLNEVMQTCTGRLIGQDHLLYQKTGDNEQPIGCIGCI